MKTGKNTPDFFRRLVGASVPLDGFARKFIPTDVALLAETDALPGTLSGPATKYLRQRAFEVFGDVRYEGLASISVAHLYNLRPAAGYEARRLHWTKPGAIRFPSPSGAPLPPMDILVSSVSTVFTKGIRTA